MHGRSSSRLGTSEYWLAGVGAFFRDVLKRPFLQTEDLVQFPSGSQKEYQVKTMTPSLAGKYET